MKGKMTRIVTFLLSLAMVFTLISCNQGGTNNSGSQGGEGNPSNTKHEELVQSVATSEFKSMTVKGKMASSSTYTHPDYETSDSEDTVTSTSDSNLILDLTVDMEKGEFDLFLTEGKGKNEGHIAHFVRGNTDYSYIERQMTSNKMTNEQLLAQIKAGEIVLGSADNQGIYDQIFSTVAPTSMDMLGSLMGGFNGNVTENNSGYKFTADLVAEVVARINLVGAILGELDKNPEMTVLELYELNETKTLLNDFLGDVKASTLANAIAEEMFKAETAAGVSKDLFANLAPIFTKDLTKGEELTEDAKAFLGEVNLPNPTKDETLVAYAKKLIVSEAFGQLVGAGSAIGSIQPYPFIYEMIYGNFGGPSNNSGSGETSGELLDSSSEYYEMMSTTTGEETLPLKNITDSAIAMLEPFTVKVSYVFDTQKQFTGMEIDFAYEATTSYDDGEYSTTSSEEITATAIINFSKENANLANLTGAKYLAGINIQNGTYTGTKSTDYDCYYETVDEEGYVNYEEDHGTMNVNYTVTVENNEVSAIAVAEFGNYTFDMGTVYTASKYETGYVLFDLIRGGKNAAAFRDFYSTTIGDVNYDVYLYSPIDYFAVANDECLVYGEIVRIPYTKVIKTI